MPFAPGGPADVVARILAAGLAERTGQPNVVENHPGAQGNIAHAAASKSAPDGHTVLFVVPSVITNPFYLKASDRSVPRPRAGDPPRHRLDGPDRASRFPPKTTADVLAFIKANPGKVSCGASGALPSVGCELLRAHAGADLLMVMYKGNAPALNALMGGEINLLFDVVNIAMGHVKSGKVRAIASTAPKRGIGPLGDLPVMAEAIPGFELVTWHGMMVAPGTPRRAPRASQPGTQRRAAAAGGQRNAWRTRGCRSPAARRRILPPSSSATTTSTARRCARRE